MRVSRTELSAGGGKSRRYRFENQLFLNFRAVSHAESSLDDWNGL